MVCLITGSSRGLGKAIALAFGKMGHQVVIHYKDKSSKAEEVASQIKGSIVLNADVRNFKEVKTLTDEVIKRWGRIDILVNNAGITKEALLLNTPDAGFDEVMATNLKGPFNFIRTAAPYMIKQHRGHIVNIASIAGIKGRAGLSAYSTSKAALIGLTLSAASEFAQYNIMVNAVLPGYMLTDMGSNATDKAREAALRDSLLKRFSNPEEVAEFIVHLSGTSGITGQIFNLDSRVI